MLPEAERLAARSLAISKSMLGADNPITAGREHNLGMVLRGLGREDEARYVARMSLFPRVWCCPLLIVLALRPSYIFAEGHTETLRLEVNAIVDMVLYCFLAKAITLGKTFMTLFCGETCSAGIAAVMKPLCCTTGTCRSGAHLNHRSFFFCAQ